MGGFGRKPGGGSLVQATFDETRADPRGAPGKHTLTEQHAANAGRTPIERTASEELRAAILAKDSKRIMAILERNATPEAMDALCKAVGPGVANRLELILDGNEWARAKAYLGDQVALDRQLATHDQDAIFRDLQQLSDQRALDLFDHASSASGAIFQPAAPGAATGPAPAATTLAAVQEVLRDKLEPDGYAKAMRLLLDKADRALRARQTRVPPPPGTQPGDFTVRLDDLRLHPAGGPGGVIGLLGSSELDPVSAARVDLAEERIRAADARGNSAAAYLGLADLDADERKALALRLRDRPLAQATDLAELAGETDDATAIHAAIQRSQYAASLTQQAAAGIDLDAAVARIGGLVHTARMRLELLSPNAPEAERKQAQAELVRLERLFFGDNAESLPIRGALETATNGDPKAYGEQLRALGADPVTVGRELLGRVGAADIDGLIGVLKLIPVEHRVAALEAADRLDDVSAPWWPADKRELLAAYVEQGMRQRPVAPSVPVPVP